MIDRDMEAWKAQVASDLEKATKPACLSESRRTNQRPMQRNLLSRHAYLLTVDLPLHCSLFWEV